MPGKGGAGGRESTIKFRQAVAREFERLVREGVAIAEIPEVEELELDAVEELGFGHHEMADTEDQHSVSHPVRTTNLDTLFSQSVSGG